jgi:hypothetical protein
MAAREFEQFLLRADFSSVAARIAGCPALKLGYKLLGFPHLRGCLRLAAGIALGQQRLCLRNVNRLRFSSKSASDCLLTSQVVPIFTASILPAPARRRM